MSNADKVRALLESMTVRKCKVAQRVDEQDQETQDLFNEIMWMSKSNPKRPTNFQIAQALRTLGYDISDTSLDRHRRKSCVCFAYSGKDA